MAPSCRVGPARGARFAHNRSIVKIGKIWPSGDSSVLRLDYPSAGPRAGLPGSTPLRAIRAAVQNGYVYEYAAGGGIISGSCLLTQAHTQQCKTRNGHRTKHPELRATAFGLPCHSGRRSCFVLCSCSTAAQPFHPRQLPSKAEEKTAGACTLPSQVPTAFLLLDRTALDHDVAGHRVVARCARVLVVLRLIRPQVCLCT